VGAKEKRGHASSHRTIPESERDYFLERKYPTYGNLAPRDIASRAAKQVCDEGRGVGPGGRGVYLDFAEATKRLGDHVIKERSANLFDMYAKITGETRTERHAHLPRGALHDGRLWVDYNLMSNIPGLHVVGEANFSDHGPTAWASALMQGLADGLFRSALYHRPLFRLDTA